MMAALEDREWWASRPGRALPPGKTRYPLYRRLGGPQGWSGQADNLVPTGIRSRTVQPVVSRYTDWATSWPTARVLYLLKIVLFYAVVSETWPISEKIQYEEYFIRFSIWINISKRQPNDDRLKHK